jgi:hypothetical protein
MLDRLAHSKTLPKLCKANMTFQVEITAPAEEQIEKAYLWYRYILLVRHASQSPLTLDDLEALE